MTQEEKAREVLEQLFYAPRNRRTGLSEKFLRNYAGKKMGGQGRVAIPGRTHSGGGEASAKRGA